MGCEQSSEAKRDNFLIITANVGSLFENQEVLEDIWLNAFSETVNKYKPHFIALHCQEIGGKFYAKCKESVQNFIDKLSDCKALKSYTVQRGYVDEDHEHVDQYTALGSFYFIHSKVDNLQLYDFHDKKFKSIKGKQFYTRDLNKLADIRKEKFKQDFFPACRWSRKGYIRTRWRIGKRMIELVNIHLFHDESNLLAMMSTPSSYSTYRKRALEFVVNRLSKDEGRCENGIYFMFGDLNFRLDLKSVVQKLLSDSKQQVMRSGSDEHDEVVKIIFRQTTTPTTPIALANNNGDAAAAAAEDDDDEDVGLVLGKKQFECHRSIIKHDNSYDHLREFDSELESVGELHEFDVTFPPTYPCSEDVDEAGDYMKTRCPAWCDRILLSPSAWQLLRSQKSGDEIRYGRIGDDSCMGDHKPVFLSFSVAVQDD